MAANTKKTTKKSTGKTPAKKPAARRASGQGNRTKSAPSKAVSMETLHQRRQIKSVILFAVAILFACLVIVEGDNLWRWSHNAMLGIFGGWAILGPILMAYVAVVSAMDRPHASMALKIWLSAAVIVLCCGAGFIFSEHKTPTDLDFFGFIQHLYTANGGVGGGVVGGLVAAPLLKAASLTGAKIIIALLLFVAFMILTGTTLLQLFRTIKKPVDVVQTGFQNAMQRREEHRQLLAESEIDIPLSDTLPAHPVHSEASAMFPAPKQGKKQEKKTSESLQRLKAVFGFQEPQRESPGMAEPSEEKKPVDDSILNEAFEEIAAVRFPGTGNSTEPKTVTAAPPIPAAPVAVPVPAVPAAIDAQAAADAEKAAADFAKRAAENEKREKAPLPEGAEEMRNTYCFPPVTMLQAGKAANPAVETEELQTNGRILVETLKSFGVQTKILDICRGPSVTRYELQPAAGVKISKITNLADDLAMNLAATGVRIEAPIPGKAAVGIEVPNKAKNIVRMRELIESNSFAMAKSRLTVALGRDIAGQVTVADLGKMPHLLIAGTTGSGKSVCINSLIVSTLYKSTPDEVRFLMIDPKVVELGIYNGIPHLLVPVVTDPRKAAGALNWAVTEMLNRYKLFAENNVRDLSGYNALAASMGEKDENGQPMLKMPQIVIIIDELSDLMMAAPNEVEDAICRLAQMARAAGMHLVVATQRPSVDVVTGLIKANIPSRIAFAVSSAVDSRTILDGGGAEKLLGQGDMLFSPVGASKPKRIQGCYVSDGEIESITEFVKKSKAITYDETVLEEIEKNAVKEQVKSGDSGDDDGSSDPMMDEAIRVVVEAGQASTSLLQRRLRLGYARAGRLVDEMEQMGIVGPHEGSKPRQVLMTYGQYLEKNMQKTDAQ